MTISPLLKSGHVALVGSQNRVKDTNGPGMCFFFLQGAKEHVYMGISKNRGYPQDGWFRMENPIKMDDLGLPLFSETLTSIISRHLTTVMWMMHVKPPQTTGSKSPENMNWNRGRGPCILPLSKRHSARASQQWNVKQNLYIYIYNMNIYTYNIYIYMEKKDISISIKVWYACSIWHQSHQSPRRAVFPSLS